MGLCERNLQMEREKYAMNRERLIDYQTNYNATNRDKILDYQKQYYIDNKSKLCELAKERNKQRVDCSHCGKSVLKPSLSDHKKRPICMNKTRHEPQTINGRRKLIIIEEDDTLIDAGMCNIN